MFIRATEFKKWVWHLVSWSQSCHSFANSPLSLQLWPTDAASLKWNYSADDSGSYLCLHLLVGPRRAHARCDASSFSGQQRTGRRISRPWATLDNSRPRRRRRSPSLRSVQSRHRRLVRNSPAAPPRGCPKIVRQLTLVRRTHSTSFSRRCWCINAWFQCVNWYNDIKTVIKT